MSGPALESGVLAAAFVKRARAARAEGTPRRAKAARQLARAPLPAGPGLARIRADEADTRALVRALGVRYDVFTAREVDRAGCFHVIGYEIELTGEAMPVARVWHGSRAAVELVERGLRRIAARLLGGPCEPVLCNSDSVRPRAEDGEPQPVRIRVGVYHHDHPLDDGPGAPPCLRALHERLAALCVPARTW